MTAVALNAFSYGVRQAISVAAPVACLAPKKLIDLARNVFNVMQWSFLSLYGTKEIAFDRVKDIRHDKKNNAVTHASSVNNFLNGIFIKQAAFIGPIKFNVAHGVLYFVSGVAGSLAAMHRQEWINIGGSLVFPLEVAGNCLFALASLVALIQNVKIYRAAAKVPENAPAHEREAARMLKKSAVLGIISSLNYIIAAALIMIGPAATVALVFGCIAVFTGCMKILYDFIRFRNAH